MYKRYYDGYNTYQGNSTSYGGEVVIPKDAESADENKSESLLQIGQTASESAVASISKASPLSGFSRLFENIEIDDVILLGVILLVLKDSSDDPLLIIILLVVFFSGLIDN